VVFSYCPK